jgi:effector-binding domain-containing protein
MTKGIATQGAPLSITTSYDENSWKFDAAVPVDRNDVPVTGDIKSGSTYAGKAVQFMHLGTYNKLAETAHKARVWLVVQGYKTKDRVIEEYLRGPSSAPPEQLQTRLVFPVE